MEDLSARQMRKFMEGRNEADYLLIDVRQPHEYEQGHIPGARLFPLPQLEPGLFELPDDRDLLFYCRTGSRSRTAAMLAEEAEVTEGKVYNLMGGIMGWQGNTISDFPSVQVFDGSETGADLLIKAIDLEKGAWRFYKEVVKRYEDNQAASTIKGLLKAEKAHAEMIYAFLDREDIKETFEQLWAGLEGDILEGGGSLEEMISCLEKLEGNLCLNIVGLSLDIEYSAFDLYRTMAERHQESKAAETFLSIAQAEKGHMRLLTKAIDRCDEG